MRSFLIALQFLTIFPVKIKPEIKNEEFGLSLFYFPFVGLAIGLVLSSSAILFSFLPVLVKGVLILIVSVIITGGIHLDGFADTCDGFYGNKPKEKILEIMRDSRIGAMGAMGLILLLLFKFSLIVNLQGVILWKALIEMAVFSRWSQVLACGITHSARQEGKANYFIEYSSKKILILGGVFTVVLFLLMAGLKGVFLFMLSFLCVLLFIQYVKRRIGGMTGDTIGAISEIAEVSVLFFNLLILNL
ncbi:MAG: adenosylcobinamide-GDP ribazoletransferase [Candidatus Omnitrophica bacterium]|nr:adenosylcobinamide-GDP ribazoletransferase [Candidatus Omnitrophota bacterium]MBU4303867.1 adenosylcobinamide-GDP ribazoletransferase [Candidatus Omnitrophota bacterium]MBU4418986.1 adenosylcobinamide-GDP ribazoletransferase [Candidatus Omnitrophota bacterium]MCG2708137.1 adenosylcobinamide-GDP ribazoletransferase [Candidatus Omnitrophota bacterium]